MTAIETAFPNTGVLFYNGISFGGISHVEVETALIRDDAQRTVTHHEITLTVDALVADDTSTDSQMEGIRRRLGEQGREFIFTNNGFGDDLVINSRSGHLRDVRWGPKPEVLSWKPVGSLRCCEIRWKVVLCIPVCMNVVRTSGVMAFNYSVSYSLDKGWTTRVIRGYLQITSRRVDRYTLDNADSHFDLIAPAKLLGYERTWSRDLSADKTRLDFTIVDTQIRSANAYPEYVTAIDANHRVSHRRSNMFTLYCSLSVSIELSNSVPAVTAYAIFYHLAAKRLEFAKQSQGVWLIQSITADESLFTRQSRFSMDYIIIKKPGSPPQILSDTGLFTPLGYSHQDWQTSMGRVHDRRGYSQLKHMPASDGIVDLCGSMTAWTPEDSVINPRLEQLPGPIEKLENKPPKPDQSYVDYHIRVLNKEERPVVVHEPLQAPAKASPNQTPDSASPPDMGQAAGTDAIVQEAGRPKHRATVDVVATRVGHEPVPPTITKIGSQEAVEVGREIQQEQIGDMLGVPVYKAKMRLQFALRNSPGTLDYKAMPKPSASP